MAQKSIELILFKQLAYYLNFPIFIIDDLGNLIFSNESAEKILSFRFSETGTMSEAEWSTLFVPQDKEGNFLAKEKIPIFTSATQYRIAHDQFYFRNLQNEIKQIDVVTFPILNQSNILLGVAVFFQEI